MTRRTTATLAALVLALSLTACSDAGDDDPAAPAPSAAVSAPTADGDFETTADLAAALNTGGLTCTELRDGDYPGVSTAQSCILNESEDVVLLIFATPAEKEDYLANREEFASAVVGDGWAVQTVLPETAQTVADVIGGEVVAGEQAAG